MTKINTSTVKTYHYLLSIALVTLTTFLGELVKQNIEPANLAILYLLAVVISAIFWGQGPAITTSILSVLAFDFFLIPPYLTLSVSDIQYFFTFAGFLIVGIIISTLTSKTRMQAIQASERESQTALLHRVSESMFDSETFETALETARKNISQIFNCNSIIYLATKETLQIIGCDTNFPIDSHEKEVASWVFENAKPAGWGTLNFQTAQAYYVPLKSQQIVLGVLGIKFTNKKQAISLTEESLILALASQIAMAIQRVKSAEESRKLELMRQTEKLQSALLSSISHDLRTPLASITGSLTTLLNVDLKLDKGSQNELLRTAYEESCRMNRLVGNLLDMTKMEAKALQISLKPCELRDVLGVSLDYLKDEISLKDIKINIPNDFPEIPMDFSFMVKVFFNIIDNAVKYSPKNTPIDIKAVTSGNNAKIEIRDYGMGIPEEDLKRVFDKFYRVQRPQAITSTGLGLSICKGIVEAHKGKIIAQNNSDKGSTIIIELPLNH